MHRLILKRVTAATLLALLSGHPRVPIALLATASSPQR